MSLPTSVFAGQTVYGKSAPKILNTFKKTKIWFNKANYRLMKVESFAECSKVPFVIKIFVLSILSGSFRQVLLWSLKHSPMKLYSVKAMNVYHWSTIRSHESMQIQLIGAIAFRRALNYSKVNKE